MAASLSSTEEQSKQGATDNGIEIKDIKTEIVEIEPVETKVAESSSSAITNNEKSPVLGEEFSIDASSSREEFTETDAMTSAGVPGDNDEVTSRSIWRKCPKVPGSRLTVLAQMRRMLLTPLTPSDVSKYSNCDTQVDGSFIITHKNNAELVLFNSLICQAKRSIFARLFWSMRLVSLAAKCVWVGS